MGKLEMDSPPGMRKNKTIHWKTAKGNYRMSLLKKGFWDDTRKTTEDDKKVKNMRFSTFKK